MKQLNTSKVCYSYEDIPLRTYLAIIEKRQYQLLVKAGKFSDAELEAEWETIVEENSELTGQFEYSTYKDLLIGYGQLMGDYNIDKGELMKLLFYVDDALIMGLRERGYNIQLRGDISKQEKELEREGLTVAELEEIQKQIISINSTAYAQSLADAITRSNNLVTRIEMKQKELERFTSSTNMEHRVTYEELMAQLEAALGFSVPENVTLARFNEYQKILKRKNRPKQMS